MAERSAPHLPPVPPFRAAGGEKPGAANESEEWNGTAWSEGNNLNTARMAPMGGGIQTAAFAAGGNNETADVAVNELYDGTSWGTAPSLNTARDFGGGGGTTAAGIVYGGNYGTATEELTGETSAAEAADIAFD